MITYSYTAILHDLITGDVNNIHQSPHTTRIYVAKVIIGEQHLIEILCAAQSIQITANTASDRFTQSHLSAALSSLGFQFLVAVHYSRFRAESSTGYRVMHGASRGIVDTLLGFRPRGLLIILSSLLRDFDFT